ncbi:CHAP domain-containing protein [Nonomuraea sp. H19]|uniref:CHAP domain-containing protein n=1 Tax=Nonomuraea sp. H19 TaxID=3452206 RepID=UPI003F8BFF12
MAKHPISAAPKIYFAHAALCAAVVVSALGAHTATAYAATIKAGHPVTTVNDRPEADSAKRGQVRVNVTASQVLALAKSQVGTTENAAGGGTPYQQWYANSQRAAETLARDGGTRTEYLNAPWCAMFVSWVGEHTGARPQVGWDAWTVAHAKWFAANNRFGTVPKPGAIVFFSWKGSKNIKDIQHVGFVEKDNQDGTITTIEGNTGNGRVEERVRPTAQVVGYGYPQYAG